MAVGKSRDVYNATLGEISRGAQLLRQQLPRASSSHPLVIEAAKRALDTHGFGMSSVRFICGTQDLHKELEAGRALLRHRRHDPVLVVLRRERRALRDAARTRRRDHQRRAQPRVDHRRHPPLQGRAAPLPNGDMDALEAALEEDAGKRLRMIATDGVFSMDGYLAKLDQICDLAERYDAMVMVDDSHATGLHRAHGARHARGLRGARRAST
jgi:glycine C-acetyltransferase